MLTSAQHGDCKVKTIELCRCYPIGWVDTWNYTSGPDLA